jgi:tetraacyldisaccharide 4'-kinase
MQALQRAWLRRGPLAAILWPVSLLYGLGAAANRALQRPTRLPVPVIVVGNVIAGGAGKTPVVIAVARHLTRQGLQVGVISRGYGRQGADCIEVGPHDEARRAGDEPLLVQRETGVPVFVARRRVEAARALLEAYPDTQVIVSDDGLQHHALARDVEICVFDARGIGNGWLLPAGPLREPWPRPVDLVLRPEETQGIAGHTVWRTLASHAVRADGTRAPLASLAGHKLHALAGIANPQPFFTMLRAAGLHLERTFPLPDHHPFDDGSKLDPGATLLCTEKDAAKLWRLRPDAWAVPLQLEIEPAFWEQLDRKLSSRHGSPTP